jgi:rhodanese-related sulfurtransferase
VKPAEAQALSGRAVFVDVREPYEYEAGHVRGSLHVPIGQIAARWEEIPRDRDVVVVCQVGQRSALVTDFLRERGIAAHNLEGGLEAWVAGGFELTGASGQVAEGWARDLSGWRLQP